jgi:hypothetical protein
LLRGAPAVKLTEMTAQCWSALILLAAVCTGCREDSTLELFPKQPGPMKDTACGEAPNCPPHAPICADGMCVECSVDPECKKDKPICLAGVCVTCVTDVDCPDQACNAAKGTCTKRCAQPADCGKQTCDTTRGYCVECISDGDCKPPRGTCEPLLGTCVDCAMPPQCPNCVACLPDAGACAAGTDCQSPVSN